MKRLLCHVVLCQKIHVIVQEMIQSRLEIMSEMQSKTWGGKGKPRVPSATLYCQHAPLKELNYAKQLIYNTRHMIEVILV